MRSKHYILLKIIIMITLSTGKLNAESNSIYFRNLRVSDGLPASVITSFIQDSLGFIWIGTSDGLSRYDGATFKTYRHEPGNENSLSDNYISNLYLNSKGNLWIMTSNGLDHFNLKEHTITRFRSFGGEDELADNSPTDIIETQNGTLYVSSYYSGISILNSNENEINYLSTSSNSTSALSSNNITCLQLTTDSILIIGYRNYNIDFHDLKTGETTPIQAITGEDIDLGHINSIVYDEDQSIWIGSSKGLYNYNFKTLELKDFTAQEILSGNEIESLHLNTDNQLWIGTQNNGLLIINTLDLIKQTPNLNINHYQPDHLPGSLSYRTITTIFSDNKGQKWLGTHGGGINFAENINHRFNHLKHQPAVSNSINYDKVWGMAEDNHGNIWFGTDGHGINIWNLETGVIKVLKHDKRNTRSLSDNAVLSACADYTGALWFGTYNGGLNRFDLSNQKVTRFDAPTDIPVNDIRVIYEDSLKRLWIGMNQGGLAKYNRTEDRFERIVEAGARDIRSLYFDGRYLWLGSFGQGLFRYDPESSEFINYGELIENNNQSTQSGTIFTLYGENDILWIGTRDQGLCKINTTSNKIIHFTEKEGLPNNTIHKILADSNNHLWLTTNKGISRFNIKENSFTNFNQTQGVQPEEFHNGSGLISRNGMFFFGGNNGVNYFHPDSIQNYNQENLIRFTNFKILNQSIYPIQHAPINKSIEYEPLINLKHHHRVITIEFQSIHYPYVGQSNYEYMLEGYEQNWNLLEGQNSATYRNLPPGEYLFKVRSHQSSGTYGSNEASLRIKMIPPIWKTKPAFLFYILILITIALTAFRIRVQQYKMKHQLSLERDLRQKEKRMHEERLEFFTNISHELRTPLTIISVALDDISNLKQHFPKLNKSIIAATKNSKRLMDLINKLLEFRQVETGIAELTINEINLNKFLNEFSSGFRSMAKNKKINLKLTLPVNDIVLWADQDKLSMILNNLISNAFKNTREGGQIIINIDESNNWITISVEDNGKGIPMHLQNKIFERYIKLENESTGSGIGLALTKSLVELHQGEITVTSETGKGAAFYVKLRKGNAHFSNFVVRETQEPLEPLNKKPSDSRNGEFENFNQKQILLVDDNKEIIDLLYDKFKREYSILKAYNGNEAVKLAQENCPDIIIMDIMMPEMNGLEACELIKNHELTSHIPVLLLTAKGTVEDEITGLNSKADDYISKPFNISILQARIKSFLENRQILFNYFSSNNDTIPKPSSGLNVEIEFLKKLETTILDNYLDSDVSVFDLASEMGFSRTTLYRKIRALTGLSINAFIRSVKIKKSAKLITEGMNVSEAAYASGFNDLKYFRECFKKQMAKSPSEFKIR